ncbi:MAG: hypothetical protein ACI9DQ_000541 [Glaciecola sp.]|jgi:hypothetical protein
MLSLFLCKLRGSSPVFIKKMLISFESATQPINCLFIQLLMYSVSDSIIY